MNQCLTKNFSSSIGMIINQINSPGQIVESIRGIVDRVTYHNPDNGWSVLRVLPFDNPHQQETVTVHQTKVFAGVGTRKALAMSVKNQDTSRRQTLLKELMPEINTFQQYLSFNMLWFVVFQKSLQASR